MSKKNKNRPASHAGETAFPSGETKILGKPAVEETPRIPDDEEVPAPEAGLATRRFIRTGETPYVSTRAPQDGEEDGISVNRYTDRLSAETAETRAHTGFTGKLGAYDAVHTAPETGKRMIEADLSEQLSFDDLPREAADAPETDPGEDAQETKPVGRGDMLRAIAGTADEDVRRNPDQLMMDGFDTIGMKTEEGVRKEEELEEELKSTREKKIGSFSFWNKKSDEQTGETPDKKLERAPVSKALPDFTKKLSARFEHVPTPFAPIKTEEYTDHQNRRACFAAISKAKKVTLILAAALGLVGFVLLIINAVAKGGAANNEGFIKIFGGNDTVLVALNLVCLLLAAGASLRVLKNGVFSILKLHPRADAALLATDLAVLLQTVFAFFTQKKVQYDFQLLAPAAVLLTGAYLAAEYFYREHTHQCFKSVSTKSDKSYLRTVSDPVLSVRLTGDPEGKKKAVYVGRTRFIHSFFEKSANAAAGASGHGRVIAACFAASALVGLIGWIVGKSFTLGVTGAALCLALSMPVSCLLATGFYLSGRNRSLSLKSSFVGSFDDAAALTHAENVAADAAEIFDVRLQSTLTTKGVSEKQARFVAASILKGSDSLLKKAFASDIETFDDKLAAAEDLQYEEKLGLSAWVGGCKVLLGTYELLTNHSVDVPNAEEAEKNLGENERTVYLAIEGRFAAVFTAQYRCREEVKRGAKSLVEGGSALVLSTTDANVTDAFAEQLLGLPKESVKIMNRAAGADLAAAKSVVTDSEDPGVIFSDGFTGLCRVADAAVALERIRSVSGLIGAAGSVVAVVLGAILVLTGAYHGISSISVFLLQLVFTGLCFISPLLTSFEPMVTGTLKKLGGKKKAAPEAPEAEAGPILPEAAQPEEASVSPEEAPEKTPEETPRTPVKEAPEAPAAPVIRADGDEISVEIPEDAPVKTENAGDYSDEEFSLFAEHKREKKKRTPKPGRGRKPAEPAEEAAPAPEADDGEQPTKLITSEGMRSAFNAIDDFLDDLTAGETTPGEDPGENGFSLFGASGEGMRSAEDIEDAYRRRKKEERDVRDAFTAPQEMQAPVFDLTEEEDESTEDDYEDDFTDLDASQTVDLYDDELWSRFEDDKVFAGLHERTDEEGAEGYTF